MNTQNFLTMEWAFGILTSFLIALLWHFIRVLDEKFEAIEAKHERVQGELNKEIPHATQHDNQGSIVYNGLGERSLQLYARAFGYADN